MRKGNIIDIDTAAKVIDECLHKLERLLKKLTVLYGYSGSISTLNNRAVVAVGNPNYEIATEISRVLQSARNVALPMDRCGTDH